MQTVAWASLQSWVLVYGGAPHSHPLTCTQTSLHTFLKQGPGDHTAYIWLLLLLTLKVFFSTVKKKEKRKTLYSLQLILVCAFLIILWSVWGLSLVLSYTGVAKKLKFKIFCTPHSTQYFVVLCHVLATNNHLDPPFTNEDGKTYRNHW